MKKDNKKDIKKDIKKNTFRLKEEYLFVLVALLFGVFFTFLNPPGQSNDEDRHFYNAYARSEGKFLPETDSNKIGYMMPQSVLEAIGSYQGINFFEGKKVDKKSIDKIAAVELNPSVRVFYNHTNYSINPISYLPYIFGINIGKMINSNPIYLLWSARLSGLIFYIIVIFFTIRITPIYKGLMALLALSPMALYQATSVSYDLMMISLSFMLFAIFLKFSLSKSEISQKDLLLLVIVALFHRFSKDGYFLIPFIFLLVPKNKFKNNLIYIGLLAYFVILIFLPDITWGAMLKSMNLGKGQAFQTDFLFDASKNISYHLANPLEVIKDIFFNILSQSKYWFEGAIAKFGYAYATPSSFVITLHILIILSVALIDNKKDIEINNILRYGVFAIGLMSALLIIGGFYIIGSPVGSSQVFGLQGRYFIPIIPLLLIPIYNTKYHFPVFEKFGSVQIALYSVILLSYIAIFINNYYYAGS